MPCIAMDDEPKEAEETKGRRTRRRSATWLLGGLVLLLLSVLVMLQVFGLWEIFTPDTASDTLLLYALSSLNFVAFFIFALIFIRSLLKLRRERRERLLGSKIRTRLVVYFIAVSLLPITAMAVFSFLFFNRTLEKYFSILPVEVVREAREAQRSDATQQGESLRDVAAVVAASLGGQDAMQLQQSLPVLREGGKLSMLAVTTREGETLAQSYANGDGATESMLSKELVPAWRAKGGVAEGVSVVGPFNVAVVMLDDGRMLVAASKSRQDATLQKLAAGAQTFEDFKRRQRKVRLLGLSTLGLITLLLVFVSTWIALHVARGIATPIRALAEASGEVARGNLDHRVTAIADDELAVLAAAFNEMTAQLAENRRSIERNASELGDTNLALAERRNYIETVLQTLSTGVISLDETNRVTTINAAALSMLLLEVAPPSGTPLSEVVSAEDYGTLERVLWRARLRSRATEQLELARGSAQDGGATGGGGSIPVALTATALTKRAGETGRGVVLVIEDLSELLAAQRAAAWSEVARRMAHEIKNPLTPIQLSAERIARNFSLGANGEGVGAQTQAGAQAQVLAGGNGAERERVARVVAECTATITREVAGLKAMVDEFSRFARLPPARLEPGDLNEVVRQAVALYEDRLGDVRIDVLLAHSLPGASLDAEQLRRVFVNLIDNAIEALTGVEGEQRVTIATGYDPARGLLLAEVTDTGHGIARADIPRLFQPYFSTRGRGTGLGLAIVQRIMAEHGGRIRAEHNRPRGARMIIELPVAEDARQGAGGGEQMPV
ncbi:MAG: HAMP domain-containing protein [Acidobacteria bacterium]|nr:HAMP domain-containing protein [Acidobacteriota bacterium]